MVSFYTPNGKISILESYFAELVGAVSKSAVGVAGMATLGAGDTIRCLLRAECPEKGVRVTQQDGQLFIHLHIQVVYGINIKEAVKSITHKVKYLVEEATGFPVKRVDISVDDVVS